MKLYRNLLTKHYDLFYNNNTINFGNLNISAYNSLYIQSILEMV